MQNRKELIWYILLA